VLRTVARLGTTPSPGLTRPVAEYVGAMWASASIMQDDPAAHLLGLYADALTQFDLARLGGDTLLHGNLGPQTLLTKDGTIYAIDWSEASVGPWWIDLAFLAPQLVAAGHSVEQADELLLEATPIWLEAPPDLVAGLAAVWSLYHLHQAQYGAGKRREDEQRLADAGQEWMRYALTKLTQLA
jgi:thiamine kinase-like enzyme